MSWTSEKVEKLKELWSKGHTASQIAEALGDTTRNAVIGKAHRLNLEARAPSKQSSSSKSKENSQITKRGTVPKESAYKIEGLEIAATQASSNSETKVEEKINISELLALGDKGHGEKVFKKCAACHSIVKGGKNNIGPALYNVVGRKTGAVID